MPALATLLLLIQATAASPVPAAPAQSVEWQPTARYVTAGQDEPGYRSWYMAASRHAGEVKSFNDYLTAYGVGGVVPTWQLLRTASHWQRCNAQPFEVPPPEAWPNLVQTLRYVRDRVIPAIGPVEPVSVYRNELLNRCAGGAEESAHRFMQAVDLVPLRPITRDGLMRQLCATHERTGPPYGVGLGFYVGVRFHVDSRKFRTWGTNDHGSIACARSFELARAMEANAGPAKPPSVNVQHTAPTSVPQAPAPGTESPKS